jgi:hypothetical protein
MPEYLDTTVDFVHAADCGCTVTFPAAMKFKAALHRPCKDHAFSFRHGPAEKQDKGKARGEIVAAAEAALKAAQDASPAEVDAVGKRVVPKTGAELVSTADALRGDPVLQATEGKPAKQ